MAPQKKDTYWQIHDKFLKEMFIYGSVIRSFIEQYQLSKIREIINLDIITPIRNESVDQEFRVLFSDLIFEIETISGTPIYLLFEHRSQIDKSINGKLIKYMDTFELDYLKDHEEAKAPLNIIPVLIYHGLERWTISVQRGRLENIVFFDLSSMPEEQIGGTPVLRIILFLSSISKVKKLLPKSTGFSKYSRR